MHRQYFEIPQYFVKVKEDEKTMEAEVLFSKFFAEHNLPLAVMHIVNSELLPIGLVKNL